MSAPKRPAARKPLPPRDLPPETGHQPAPVTQPPVAEQQLEPVPAQPHPAGPVVQRTCVVCNTWQPLDLLVAVATWLQCADHETCARRAAASGLYPMAENELSIAQREAAQGAVTVR